MTGFKKRRPAGALRRFEGSKLGELAQPVHVCERCGCWQTDMLGRPLAKPEFFCMDKACGGTTFERFDSKAEAKVYASLLLRIRMGELAELKRQPRFPLYVTPAEKDAAPVLLWTYVADYSAKVVATGERRVIEVKSGADTQISQIKRKHCEIQYGIKVHVTQPD
jgi:hypothetical protein